MTFFRFAGVGYASVLLALVVCAPATRASCFAASRPRNFEAVTSHHSTPLHDNKKPPRSVTGKTRRQSDDEDMLRD